MLGGLLGRAKVYRSQVTNKILGQVYITEGLVDPWNCPGCMCVYVHTHMYMPDLLEDAG